jgi:hypothetical protein
VGLIGVLQSKRIDGGWLTSYGGDVFGTAVFWWCLRRTVFARARFAAELAAAFVLAGCFAWEWSQRFDLSGNPFSITHGVFDPFDLVAYSATLSVCYGVDKGLQHRVAARKP